MNINESSGSLFDRQLGLLEGNIKPEGPSTLPVLGYFDVAGVSEVRRTFNYLPFIEEGIRTEPDICLPTDSITTSPCTTDIQIGIQVLFEREVIRVVDGDSVRFNEPYFDFGGVRESIEAGDGCVNIVDIENPGTLAFVSGAYCSDCRYHGLFDRPEVWEDQ